MTVVKAIRCRCGVSATKMLVQESHQSLRHLSESVAAAAVDDIESLRYLLALGAPWNDLTITAAVRHDSVHCLQYALTNKCPHKSNLMETALQHGNIESVKCLLRNGVQITQSLASRRWHHISVLLFLLKLGFSVPTLTCTLCAQHAHNAWLPLGCKNLYNSGNKRKFGVFSLCAHAWVPLEREHNQCCCFERPCRVSEVRI